jgi:hypothetical protein
MAGIVNEEWTWDVIIRKGATAQTGVRVIAWDADTTTPVVNELTSGTGRIATQNIQENVYSVTNTSTVATDEKTPHIVSIVKYGLFPVPVTINFGSARNDTFFVTDNTVTVQSTKTAANAITGIGVNHSTDTITITGSGVDVNDLYDYLQVIAEDEPQKDFPGGIITSVDGVNFTYNYDLEINTGLTLDGDAQNGRASITVNDVTLNGSAAIRDITVAGNVSWGSSTSIESLVIQGGVVDFTTAGTYSVISSTLNEVTNSSGGAVTLQLSSGSPTPTNTGPNITIENNVLVTLTGMKDNTEVRVYSDGTTTELAGIETATAGTTNNRSFSFSIASGTVVDIRIFSIGWEPADILDFSTTTDTTLPIQQKIDRVYSNP